MKKFTVLTILLTLLVNLDVTAQYDLSLDLEVGKTYTLTQESTSTTSQMINGMPQDTEIAMSIITNYTVTGMNGENFLIDVVPTKMSTSQSSAMGMMKMDSEGDASNPMNKLMKNLVNKTMKMELSPKGDVIMFNSNNYVAGMMEGINLPEMAKAQLEAQMATEYDDASLKDSYLGYFNIYPGESVDKGATWTTDFTADVVMPISTEATNTLSEIDDNSFTITSMANMSTGGEKDTQLMGMAAKGNLNGTAQTTYVLDRKTGWIISMKGEQDLDGDITLPASDQMPQEMKIKMKVKNITEVK